MEIRRTGAGLIIWCIAAAAVAGMGMMEYPVIGPQTALVEQSLAMIPKMGQIVFGVYGPPLSDPLGYFAVMAYWCGLIIFAHAMYTGASMVAKENRDKTTEYLFTMPCARKEIVWAKILAIKFNILVMGIVNTVVNVASMTLITLAPEVYGSVLLACLGMFFIQCVLAALGLLCSAIFKTYRAGVLIAAAVLVVSYCLMFAVQYFDAPSLNYISPLTFFGAWDVAANGINVIYAALAVAVMVVCVFAAQVIYRVRDLDLR